VKWTIEGSNAGGIGTLCQGKKGCRREENEEENSPIRPCNFETSHILYKWPCWLWRGTDKIIHAPARE